MSTTPALATTRALARTRTGTALAATVLGLTALGAAPALAGPAAPDVPTDVQVLGDHKPFLVGHAIGTQVYSCRPDVTGHRWVLDGPVAALYGDNGRLLASHSAGPTWTARDGSWVRAEAVGRATVDATAIPWLRLRATAATAGPDGGRLAGTTFVQRIATTGGLAPAATDCSATTVGETRAVAYTADYVFWKKTAAS